MSDKLAFLVDLRRLMERIPEDLSLEELQWAQKEAALALGCKIACRLAQAQFKDHVPGTGTH
jgi:hypothetical protein